MKKNARGSNRTGGCWAGYTVPAVPKVNVRDPFVPGCWSVGLLPLWPLIMKALLILAIAGLPPRTAHFWMLGFGRTRSHSGSKERGQSSVGLVSNIER